MKNINKTNQNCHPELVSGSMVVSAWKVEDNLNGSCRRVNGFRTKSGMAGECGRSMVEMLGVLAIIGVLSVGGIAGYTTAMNKHKANEILNAASVRAMAVSTQIQNGSSSPTLAEFTDNKVAGATFGTDVKNTAGTGAWVKGTDNRFSLTLSDVDTKVCNQMKNIAGESSIIKAWGDNCAFLTYNNGLSATAMASDYKTQEECKSPFKWCSGWPTPGCADDCCTGVDLSCTSCNPDTGKKSYYNSAKKCNYNGGTDNGVCSEGSCIDATGLTTDYNMCMESENNENFCRCYAVSHNWSYCYDNGFQDCIINDKKTDDFCGCMLTIAERCEEYDCEKWCNLVGEGNTMAYSECMSEKDNSYTDEMCKCVAGSAETVPECNEGDSCTYTHCDCRTLQGKSYEECEDIW